MKLVFIEVGRPPEPIGDSFGCYPKMLEDLIAPHFDKPEFQTCSMLDGDALPCLDNVDGVVIMGSPHSVYDDIPWIEPLMDLIREASSKKVPQIGICFGHQLIAKALGGDVRKAPQGWGIGRHTYEVNELPEFLKDANAHEVEKLNVLVSHQDQVLEPPKGAKVLASSDFTPNAVIYYEEHCALTTQAHPEFTSDFAYALIASRRGTRFSEDFADKALETVHDPIDRNVLANWMVSFFKTHKGPSHKEGGEYHLGEIKLRA